MLANLLSCSILPSSVKKCKFIKFFLEFSTCYKSPFRILFYIILADQDSEKLEKSILMKKILVIGAAGQIGTDLTIELRNRFGAENVIASDIKLGSDEVMEGGPFEKLDAMDKKALETILDEYQITEIYHLAAILSGKAEKNPKWAWDLNMNSLFNVLDISRAKGISKIFWPSSMGAFGPTTPKWDTPQITVMEPTSVYSSTC